MASSEKPGADAAADPARSPLSHLDGEGRARMVDVSGKDETVREAIAEVRVVMAPETLALIERGGVAKGDVLAVARVAGIMAAKRTGELIPLCHPLPVDAVDVDFDSEAAAGVLHIRTRARTPRAHRRRDGGHDRGVRRGAHCLRHVQGGREGHPHRGPVSAREARRQVRQLGAPGAGAVSTLTVRYFASLRERLGIERETLPASAEGISLMELLERLALVHDEEVIEALTGPGVRIAVNDTLVDGDPGLLAAGDVVAFLPPVTGG